MGPNFDGPFMDLGPQNIFLRVLGPGSRVSGLGLLVKGIGSRVSVSPGSRYWVSGLGFTITQD